MSLQRQAPLRMLQHSLDTRFQVGLALNWVVDKARLQETMTGLDVVILTQVLSSIDHLELVAAGEHSGEQVATCIGALGRQSHPVDARWQWARAVGLDGDGLACALLERGNHLGINP